MLPSLETPSPNSFTSGFLIRSLRSTAHISETGPLLIGGSCSIYLAPFQVAIETDGTICFQAEIANPMTDAWTAHRESLTDLRLFAFSSGYGHYMSCAPMVKDAHSVVKSLIHHSFNTISRLTADRHEASHLGPCKEFGCRERWRV